MDSILRISKNDIFQQLKPYCIDLSRLALKNDDTDALIQSAERLSVVLQRVCDNEAFDEKLADYVFFPLSQILRAKQKYTDRLSELTAKCLRLLLEHGWHNTISIDLAKQLLILLTLMVGGVPGQDSKTIPEELGVEALGGLAALFNALSRSPGAATAITDSDTIPAVGHSVTTILDAINEGSSAEIQMQSLKALSAAWCCLKDIQAQTNFLPGTVSALTRCLTPSTSLRRTKKVILEALESLKLVLTTTLSDIRTLSIRADASSQVQSARSNQQTGMSKSWLNATTSQVKLALANVIKLRTHKSDDVRNALNRFCIVLLDECHDTLMDSTSMLVETCLSQMGLESTIDTGRTSIIDLAAIHSNIGESIKSIFYHWVSSLPRVLQMNDESAKVTALHQLSAAYQLLSTLNLTTSLLDDALSQSLRDSVSSAFEMSSLPSMMQETSLDVSSQAVTNLFSQSALMKTFRPVLMPEESQKTTRNEMLKFISSLGKSQLRMDMANEMLDYVRSSSGPTLLAAYWISSQLVENATTKNDDLDAFFESALLLPDDFEATSQDLFSYSISVLATEDTTQDWRMKAIALEVISGSAKRLGRDFRVELVDVLYPVSQLLGSPSRELKERATVCLNVLSASCGYRDVRELIVENVDYMVNAISLRLNTFDISPQTPQVLIMMIRLTGSSLIPYLDDVVSSMFAALDNFHGYQGLVEALFAVLGEIVDTGSKSGQLRLPDAPAVEHTKTSHSFTLSSITQALAKQRKPDAESDIRTEDFPHKPWKSASELLDKATMADKESEEEIAGALEIQKSPPTKTYTMVQSIARLSQHYLTNQSPTLRARLLTLVSTSSLALHHDQEAFLPLVNDIWPVVIERLYDKEPFVVIAAAGAVSTLSRCAGNFLATRIAVQWPRLMNMARRTRASMLSERTGSAGRGIFSQVAQVWESVLRLLSAVAEFTGINDDAFDDVVELLAPALRDRADVREALSTVNADAVWLAVQAEQCTLGTPSLEGYEFLSLRRTLQTKQRGH